MFALTPEVDMPRAADLQPVGDVDDSTGARMKGVDRSGNGKGHSGRVV